jgi:DNA polymerase-4
MDAYFASVELLRHPELRGLPLVIGGPRGPAQRLRDYRGRGVVTTCTYEARAFGVRSGMGLMKAAALAGDALLLPADPETYRAVSRAFKAAVVRIAPLMEDRGIDEIYLDLTDLPGESVHLARRLKDAVLEATGLTCSIGITPNKLLSKIASELDKPDGLTLLSLEDVPVRIWPLGVGAVNGIGPKATARLEALGIRTVGDLAAADPSMLRGVFGEAYGAWLADAAQGRDDSPLTIVREPKSLSRETTFPRDLHPKGDRERLTAVLLDLCHRLAGDLDRKGVRARTVGIKVRFEDFSTLSRDLTLPRAVAGAEDLRDAARECLRRVVLDRRIRLLGLRAAGLERPGGAPEPRSLFLD